MSVAMGRRLITKLDRPALLRQDAHSSRCAKQNLVSVASVSESVTSSQPLQIYLCDERCATRRSCADKDVGHGHKGTAAAFHIRWPP